MSPLRRSPSHLPYNPELVGRAKELRLNMTPAEQKLWFGYLRNFKFRVLRQRPIDYFIVDFYCAKLKLVIEVDGAGHFTPEGRAADQRRTGRLASYGITVLRFGNEEVMQQFKAVCDRIQQCSKSREEEIAEAN